MNLYLLIFGKFKLWSQYLRIFGIHLLSKNYYPVSLLFVVNKFFEKLVNNKVVDHLEKFGFFSDLQYDFRPSHSTTILTRILTGFGTLPLFKVWYPSK